MARPDQEAIDTFMSITGVSEAAAIQKLEEHRGSLNEAVNEHFSEGDRNIAQEAPLALQDDVMEIDDPTPVESRIQSSTLQPFARDLSPSLPNPNFTRSISGTDIASQAPFVSHPRAVREIPVEVENGTEIPGHPGTAPIIEGIAENAHIHGAAVRSTVILCDDNDVEENIPDAPITHVDGHGNRGISIQSGPSAPAIVDMPDYSNDIEEEMIRAAIEASKQDAAMPTQHFDRHDIGDPGPQPVQSHLENAELAHAVSLSLQTAEKEKAPWELQGKLDAPELEAQKSSSSEEKGKSTSPNGRQPRLEIGSSSIQDETEDVEEELQLVRHRRRRVTSSSADTTIDIVGVEVSPPSSPQRNDVNHSRDNASDFPSEWGGISSEEHDEAVMLEAAMFGGVPEGTGYHFPYAPHQLMQDDLHGSVDPYPMRVPRPPSPSLTAQRLIREQQDDEYLAALRADREKELKAKEDAEAALAEERRKEDEFRRQMQEQQEIEKQLAAKEASLPQEPTADEQDAVTLLVRMPDGSRRGRRFRTSDKLQHLFDYIDVGRGIAPGSYRLVRPYPRRAFSDGESVSTLNELGLTSRQEALYLELI